MNLVEILEQYPSVRMLYKQMDKNIATGHRLKRLRMKALKRQEWDTAAELEIERLHNKSEYNILSDRMIAYLKELKAQGVQMV